MSAPRLWKELARLDARVLEARDRLDELAAERGRVEHRVERALAPLREYNRAVGAGEREADAREEARLRAAAEEAQASVRMVPRRRLGGEQIGTEMVDDALEARIAGAAEARDRAVWARDAFVREHAGELEAQLAPAAEKAREAVNAAFARLREAEREWTGVLQRAARVADGRRLPANPLSGLGAGMERGGAPLPLPLDARPEPVDPDGGITMRPASPGEAYAAQVGEQADRRRRPVGA